ncbi:uncharacterized protein LOC128983931 [Macrosteles quadrilineatus]|uniref:uncharacterized protein LOC128983931 n=1 Tax=Macrosteles quadrilineatus TaxID=74068 RepID=UPI0023E09E21|nr:uncharacterized protein LOC128983931 [Macrosteles quadrilineatus]
MITSVCLLICVFSVETKPVFYNKQTPLTEVFFVTLQVRALMKDVKDPVRLAGSLAKEAKRVLTHARSYLLEIQMPEKELRDEYRMSDRDVSEYQELWAESIQELNKLEYFFKIRDQVNNNTRNR